MKTINAFLILGLLTLLSCTHQKLEPIKLNIDKCNNCGMTISDIKFAAELVTNKGRSYKFDDIACMMKYIYENKENLTKTAQIKLKSDTGLFLHFCSPMCKIVCVKLFEQMCTLSSLHDKPVFLTVSVYS